MPALSFIVANSATPPNTDDVIAAAAEINIGLAVAVSDDSDVVQFDITGIPGGGGALMVMPVAAQHPDLAHMGAGPLSPDPDTLDGTKAHYIVTALGLEGSNEEQDTIMAALTAAVLAGIDAKGVMLGHGVLFHRPELFTDFAVAGYAEGYLPIEICIDISAARESDERMSFLSYNMPRYGREDFYITCGIESEGAIEFMLGLLRWMITDPDKDLPTGDTIGRTADEKLEIQRAPSPVEDDDAIVIKIDMP